MFTRARLRLTVLYAAMMAGTLALVAAGIVILGTREAQSTADQELRLRAEGIAADEMRAGFRPPSGGRPNDAHGPREDHGRLESQGLLSYVLPVEGGRVKTDANGTIPGLPDLSAAQEALASRAGCYRDVTLPSGSARVYSRPLENKGQPVAVIQVAQSTYFTNEATTRLLVIVLALGLAGVAASAGAGFWLAGRSLRPIAQAMERQRAFTADASHELRTPLALVRGNAELLLRHPERPIQEYQDVVEDIVSESDRLSLVPCRVPGRGRDTSRTSSARAIGSAASSARCSRWPAATPVG